VTLSSSYDGMGVLISDTKLILAVPTSRWPPIRSRLRLLLSMAVCCSLTLIVFYCVLLLEHCHYFSLSRCQRDVHLEKSSQVEEMKSQDSWSSVQCYPRLSFKVTDQYLMFLFSIAFHCRLLIIDFDCDPLQSTFIVPLSSRRRRWQPRGFSQVWDCKQLKE